MYVGPDEKELHVHSLACLAKQHEVQPSADVLCEAAFFQE